MHFMAKVGTYLNFARNTEEAFNFYKTVFGGEFAGPGFSRFRDIPPSPDVPPVAEADKDLVMHASACRTGIPRSGKLRNPQR